MTTADFQAQAVAQMDAVHRMALHLARRPDDAADLVQETYLRAMRYAHTYTPGEHGIRPWLLRILHNVFYNTIRSAKRRREMTDRLAHEQPLADDAPEFVALQGDDADALDWDATDDRLKHAIDQLDDRHRQVLLLWAVEGYKYRQIATVLDVPIGTVMSRLHRARRTLKAQLAELAAEHNLALAA